MNERKLGGVVKDKIKKVLQVSVLAGFIVIVMILGTQVNHVSAENITNDQILALRLINDYRSTHGLNNLRWNDKLAKAALDKAQDMDKEKYFEHTSPKGVRAWSFVLKENYQYRNAGENLAIDFNNVAEATDAWEKSESHLKNIVSTGYTDFGYTQMKTNIEGKSTTVFVQIFASEEPLYDRVLNNITK